MPPYTAHSGCSSARASRATVRTTSASTSSSTSARAPPSAAAFCAALNSSASATHSSACAASCSAGSAPCLSRKASTAWKATCSCCGRPNLPKSGVIMSKLRRETLARRSSARTAASSPPTATAWRTQASRCSGLDRSGSSSPAAEASRNAVTPAKAARVWSGRFTVAWSGTSILKASPPVGSTVASRSVAWRATTGTLMGSTRPPPA
mmetsp:Transcript_2868/g.10143  ORF Transcript_2868/g.10143 Transcript_2868/m.10143 type:complete len:208 (+) Transcript_2868:707-1330(+)